MTTAKTEWEGPFIARYGLRCAVQQRIEEVVSLGDQMHRALVLFDSSNPLLTGHNPDRTVLRDHQHAYYLPVDEDRDGYLDAILVYFDKRFDARTERTLRQLRQLDRADGGHAVHLALEALGPAEDHRQTIPALAPARRWESATPFLFSRFTKSGPNGLKRALAREVADHREPVEVVNVRPIEQLKLNGRAPLDWSRFRSTRKHGGGRKISDTGHGFELEFDRPINGPLALGYGSHYGLGQFRPLSD